jgi:hypothetical protein
MSASDKGEAVAALERLYDDAIESGCRSPDSMKRDRETALAALSAVRPQEPDGYALLFMPGTEHFCYVGIWTKREPAEHMLSKTRGGDSRIAPMYFAAPSWNACRAPTSDGSFNGEQWWCHTCGASHERPDCLYKGGRAEGRGA